MFFSPRLMMLGLSFLFIPFSANATPLCEYAAYSVPVLHRNILDALNDRGYAVVPAAYFSTSAAAKDVNEEFWVLSAGELYAKLSFNESAFAASSEIKLNGPDGKYFATAKSIVTPCDGGWCRESTIKTALDIVSDKPNRTAGLEISQRPSYGMMYSVYGETVGVTSWRTQFIDRYEWMLNVLTDRDQAVSLQPFTDTQRFMFAMASKPALTPFLNEIEITVARDGHFIVKGRVTHAAYNSMIDAALENGFYNIEPLLVIDSAAGERFQDRDLGFCLGRDYY